MYFWVIACVLMLFGFERGSGDDVASTTKTYELQVPGSSSIKIIEAEPIWDVPSTTQRYKSEFEHRAFGGKPEMDNKFSPDALKQFLRNYANKLKNTKTHISNVEMGEEPKQDEANKRVYDDEGINDYEESTKSWDMLKVQRHNHPYEDKKGWVTLEAVPWSVSKVSKWHSNNRHHNNPKPWESDYEEPATHRPYHGNYNNDNQRPFNNYQIKPANNFDFNTNDDDDDYYQKRPSAFYAQKVYLQQSQHNQHNQQQFNNHEDAPRPSWHKKPHYNHYDKYQNNEDDFGYAPDIITDGRPADFPHPTTNRRRGGPNPHQRPETHPFATGDGDWVLVSTTRGYKYPKNRERALHLASDSLGAHRTVRLTVLPPLKDSKVNMTTSHGGLLQVESTFQSVEQDQKNYANKVNKQKQKLTTKRPNRVANKISKPPIAEATIRNTFSTRNNAADSSAVLAAVGAGMIPATMAMLVPMALGGRRRRDVNHTTPQSADFDVEITLPRSL